MPNMIRPRGPIPVIKIGTRTCYAVRDLEQAFERMKSKAILRDNPGLAGVCFKGSCLDMLSAIEDGSVALLHGDTPYPGLTKCPGKGYVSGRSSTSGLRLDCEMQPDEEAVNLIIELLRTSLVKLKKNGCFLLWLAGGVPDPWRILKAAEDYGWSSACCGYWKKSPQPGDFNTPWTCSTERFIVFCRKGEKVLDHVVGASRDQVIELEGTLAIEGIASVTRGVSGRITAATELVGKRHQYQKPEALSKFIIERLTHPGELCVDLCGCSGSFVIAAATMPEPRRWMYCELEPNNYAFGVCRIADATLPASEASKSTESEAA